MATYYVDGTRADDTGAGTSEATAKKTISAGLALLSGGDTLYIKASTTYTLTSGVSLTVAGSGTPTVVEGYTTTPGARDGRPIITSSTNSVNLLTITVNHIRVRHLKFTHTAASRGYGIYIGGAGNRQLIDDCLFDGCYSGVAMPDGNFWNIYISRCEARNSISDGFYFGTHNSGYCWHCASLSNGGSGFNGGIGTGTRYFENCLAGNNAGYGFFWTGSSHSRASYAAYCTAGHNSADGFCFSDDGSSGDFDKFRFYNNLSAGNGGYGLNISSANGMTTAGMAVETTIAFNNAYGLNTSGARIDLAIAYPGDVILTVDPFVDWSNNNFNLNNTAGGGAACRGAGYPGTYPGGLTGYRDIGAIQHQDLPVTNTFNIIKKRRRIR